jgi:dipeptidyl-peptidase-3
MTRRLLALCLAVPTLVAISATPRGQTPPPAATALVERVGDTAFIQIEAESFKQLDAKQQALAYWLTQASIAIDPIIYDQLSRFGLREKRLLEEIVARPAAVPPATFAKIRTFALLFWANRGNHNENTTLKFLPAFTFEELRGAALKVQAAGGFKTPYGDLPALTSMAAVTRELEALRPALFDPNVEPSITAKTPPAGQDILQASSNTFYQGVTLAELANFKEQYPLNSRVVKGPVGALREEVYRAGTPDGKIAPGLYAVYLKKAIGYLEKARALADPAQATVIGGLITFYQTGDPKDWLQFGSDWVRNDATVDFANGFIEVYRDARGAKGSMQSFVSITDRPVTDAMVKLAQNAAYFEDKAPWDPKYKKQAFQPPVVKAVQVLVETGDFHVTTIGDNLPNENEIHEKYGTKNFLFIGSSHALGRASGGSSRHEFAASPEIEARGKDYGEQAEDLMTAMHEVIGHGSGKLSDRLKNGAEPLLKEYFSTLEEARADLMALWNIWDPKLKELGLVADQDNVAKAMYDSAASVVLQQLRRIPRGDTINEDHARDRALISNYIKDKTGAIEQIDRGGRAYIQVKDYQKMREGVRLLLTELMRIKAEGDYAAIKALVDQYGVHFDPKLRDQVVARYKQLDLPAYWAGVNVEVTASIDARGAASNMRIANPRDPVHQYLSYGRMYDAGLLVK